MTKVKLLIVCTFLGIVNRGFEVSAQENFNILSQESDFDVVLIKGGGEAGEKEITPWNPLLSDRAIAQKLTESLGKLFQKKPNYMKKAAFFLTLLPHIAQEKPDVIYFSEIELGRLLARWRHLTQQNYKLLFRNGANRLPPFPFDRIQQLNPGYLQAALERGVPAQKQILLPSGFPIASELTTLTLSEKENLQKQLELPNSPLLISVGAVNAKRKRMDYVIREVANLPEPRPYLLLLGQQDAETPPIIALGKQLLQDRFTMRTVPYREIANYYRVADAFVFASTYEAFGRVYVEAMSQGLPCLVHDYEVSRFVLENEGYFADLTVNGNLTKLLTQVLAEDTIAKHHSRHQSVYERFSWDKLKPRYVDMIQDVANEDVRLPISVPIT